MKVISLVILVAVMASHVPSARGSSHKGKGTAYSGPFHMDATGQNMCEFHPSNLDKRWQIYYGAMNEEDWDAIGGKDSICGRCIAVRGVKGQTTSGFDIRTIVVKIVDQCPSWACDKGNVDFSTSALKAITGYGWDKKSITWEYVDCPGTSARSASRKASIKNRSSSHRRRGKRGMLL